MDGAWMLLRKARNVEQYDSTGLAQQWNDTTARFLLGKVDILEMRKMRNTIERAAIYMETREAVLAAADAAIWEVSNDRPE